MQASAWFREVVRDKITHALQSKGNLFKGTATAGDVKGKTVKFCLAGRGDAYEITGAIEPVTPMNAGRTNVTATIKDYEASDFIFTPDLEKMGPNELEATTETLRMAIGRKSDFIQTDALALIAATGGSGVTTIGDGTTRIDIPDVQQAAAEIVGAGGDPIGKVFCALPAMWFEQLKLYKEFSNSQYVGPDLPFAKQTLARTYNFVNYFVVPDEYFASPNGTDLYAYMWHKDYLGVESNWDKSAPTFDRMPQLKGTPWLGKVGLGGAAVGILGGGIKRLQFLKQTKPVRPA